MAFMVVLSTEPPSTLSADNKQLPHALLIPTVAAVNFNIDEPSKNQSILSRLLSGPVVHKCGDQHQTLI